MRICLAVGLLIATTVSGYGTEEERLVATGQLWYAAKQFHPYLAYKDIDWDGALVKALPGIRAAETDGQFARAVQIMLDALGDPATEVVRKRVAKATGQHRWFDVEKKGDVVVARFRPDVEPGLTVVQAGAEVEKALEGAQALVMDLRSVPEAVEAQEYVGLVFGDFVPLGRKLIDRPLFVPGYRSRYLDAFEPGFRIMTDAALNPLPEAKATPITFIFNRHSRVPAFALGLQADGRALIVLDGDGELTPSGLTLSLPLEGEWRASLRTKDIVMRDGTGLPEPTLRVHGKDAVAEAITLARSPAKASKTGAILPAVPQPRVAAYKPGLPAVEERLLAAFEIWGSFYYLSAYPHLMDEDLTTVLRRFIPRFISASDERSYALTVAEMVAQVHDTHAVVRGPALTEYFGAAPAPANIQFVRGRPVVRRVLEAGSALQVGDIILKIDGRDVQDRIRELSPYIAASTPQSLRYRLAGRLLNGPNESKAKLVVDRAGSPVEVEVERSTVHEKELRHNRDGEVYRMLPGNIGYVDLERLPPQDVDAMFDKFRDTTAIVMDMRGYPQGTAWSIAPRLTDKTNVAAASFRRPNWTGPDDDTAEVKARLDYRMEQFLPPTDKWRYKGETVVLIDERAISQSEHSCLFFRVANGSKFIGTPTTGANGDVRNFTVPGGIRISYSGHEVKHIDGRQLQRVGIQPDILVEPTIEGIRAGRDEVLERAIHYLKTRQ